MRVFSLFVYLTCAAVAHADVAVDHFERAKIDRFDEILERVLTPGPGIRDLRARATKHLSTRAAETRGTEWFATAQSKRPWTRKAEHRYARRIDELADRVAADLAQISRDRRGGTPARVTRDLARVLGDLAEHYAILSTFEGNRAAMYVNGLLKTVPPITLIGLIVPVLSLMTARDLGAPLPLHELAWPIVPVIGGLSASAATVVSTRPRVRKMMIANEEQSFREPAAQRLERRFWDRLMTQATTDPDLTDFKPTAHQANFRALLISRLTGLGHQMTKACETWLANPEIEATAPLNQN